MNNPHKGKFITLEGGEGTGKSTQIEFMIQSLKARGIPVIATREPGGSEGAELIRNLLVKGDVHRWDSVTEALLMNAARRDHLKSLIVPALEKGTWVICDRFADSTLAYQGYGHGIALSYLNAIYELIAGDLTPDLTFVFDLDPRLGLERAKRRGDAEDRFERMPIEFHERIREGFRRIAQTDLNRYILIDASLDRTTISQQVSNYIEQRLKMTPREQTQLFGHEQIEADLLSAFKKGRMPHSLLLTGPKGVGRATLAYRLAKFLLSNPSEDAQSLAFDPDSSVVRRIISGGHGDLQVIEPDPEKATKEISVDQARQIKHFLSQTSMEGGWRIVIVDGEMNGSAANAVLKVLEEPPKKSLLIIMSESAGRVLPTIRSRCHMIKLKPLSQTQVAQVVKAEQPQITSDEMQVLTALCDGRPGLALQYHAAQAVTMYRDLLKVLGRLSAFNYGEALAMSQKYSAKSKSEDSQMDSFVVVGDCLKRFIQKLTRYGTVQDTSSTLPEEIPIFQQALTIRSAVEWARIWESVNLSFRQGQKFHLDKAQVMFCSLCEIAGVKI